jgi:hypothetical protein
VLSSRRQILRAGVRAVLALPRLLRGELRRIGVARHGDVHLTVGLAAGMLLSLCAMHTFGYRVLPSVPIEGSASAASRGLGRPHTAGRLHVDPRGNHAPSWPPDHRSAGASGNLDVEG